MLGKLVSKFKRQTLQDGNSMGAGGAMSPPGQLSPPPAGRELGAQSGTRRSARLNEKAEKEGNKTGGGLANANSPSPPNTRARRAQQQQQQLEAATEQRAKQHTNQLMMASTGGMQCDSGTESDDDELEMLDSLSNASRAVLEDGIGRSPPTLTSSPPLISEIDTSSWDSCGCESGIVLRDSAERDDASRNLDLLEAAFGGGELVMEIKKNTGADTAGTTPVQSKDAFPSHFRAGTGAPLPIDFSALRHSELNGGIGAAHPDEAPTPIGSQKGPGHGAMLMEMAQMGGGKAAEATENQQPAAMAAPPQQEQPHHQGAFRRVLRRTRRNSNSTASNAGAGNVAARTVSPTGIGLGEKRRWDAPATAAMPPTNEPVAQPATEIVEREAMPIAARTRGSLLMGMLGGGGGGEPGNPSHFGMFLLAQNQRRCRTLQSILPSCIAHPILHIQSYSPSPIFPPFLPSSNSPPPSPDNGLLLDLSGRQGGQNGLGMDMEEENGGEVTDLWSFFGWTQTNLIAAPWLTAKVTHLPFPFPFHSPSNGGTHINLRRKVAGMDRIGRVGEGAHTRNGGDAENCNF